MKTSKNFLIVFLLAILFIQINSQAEQQESFDEEKEFPSQPETEVKKSVGSEIFDQVRGYRLRSESEMRFLTEISDMTFLVFYYKPNSVQSQKVAKYLPGIVDRLKNLASIMMIDCSIFQPESFFNCREYEYGLDSFPRLKLLIPPEKRYDSLTKEVEVHYEYPWTEPEMNENTIYNFIVNNVPDKAVKLTKENLYVFLNNDLFNKVILFTDKPETSLLWRGITNYFYEKVLFGEVFKSEGADLVKKFNVTKFPTLILYKVNDYKRLLDEPEIIKYEGLIESQKLIEWIQPHAMIEKRYVLQKRGVADTTPKEMARTVEFRTVNRTNYEEYLNKFTDKNVVFYFNTKNNPKLSVKEVLIHNHGFFISSFFDCDKDRAFCLEKFNVTKFPMLKVLPRVDNTTTIEERIKSMKTFDISKNANSSLKSQIREFFPSKVEHVISMEFPFKVANAKYEEKNMIVHFYSDEDQEIDTLPLDLLSQDPEISKSYIFLSVKNPSPEILKMNQLPWKTGIFYFQKIRDDFKVIPVSRDAFYSSLFNTADSLTYLVRNFRGRPPFHSDSVQKITTSAQLRRECLDLEFCVILFFDARPGEESQAAFADMIGKVERVKMSSKRYDGIKFNWVNATCHSYLAEKFDINMKDLPAATFYYRWRGFYSTFIGLWESFTLGEYFERCVNNRYPSKEIEKDAVYLKNLVCEQVISEQEQEEDIEHQVDNVHDSGEQKNSEEIKKENTQSNEEKIEVIDTTPKDTTAEEKVDL